ncbi:unnamed protein product [Camellia sinensis]
MATAHVCYGHYFVKVSRSHKNPGRAYYVCPGPCNVLIGLVGVTNQEDGAPTMTLVNRCHAVMD